MSTKNRVVYALLAVALLFGIVGLAPQPVQAAGWSVGMFVYNRTWGDCSYTNPNNRLHSHCIMVATTLNFHPKDGCYQISFKGDLHFGDNMNLRYEDRNNNGTVTYSWGIRTRDIVIFDDWWRNENWRFYKTC